MRSYLAVPVASRSGEVLGGLFFGHPGFGGVRDGHVGSAVSNWLVSAFRKQASSAEKALAEMAKDADRFDVVFSDVVMPGMNGIDLAHEIPISITTCRCCWR